MCSVNVALFYWPSMAINQEKTKMPFAALYEKAMGRGQLAGFEKTKPVGFREPEMRESNERNRVRERKGSRVAARKGSTHR